MLVAGLVFLLRFSTPAQTATSSPCGAWEVITGPDSNLAPYGGDFDGVAAVSDDDVWLVGKRRLSDPNAHPFPDNTTGPLFAHWDGRGLAAVPAPQMQGSVRIDNMWNAFALSKGDVWATGYQMEGVHYTVRDSKNGDGVLFHWDGTRWGVVPGPSPPLVAGEDVCDYDYVRVVPVAKNDMWAFGQYEYKNEVEKSLVQHWDGTEWSVVPAPDVGGKAWGIDFATAVSPDDVWAIGRLPDPNGSPDYLIHWNGDAWSIAASSRITSTTHYIKDIAASPSGDVWVVGSIVAADGGEDTVAAHWDGKSWSISPTPDIPLPPGVRGGGWDNIRGVAVVSPSDVWAVVIKWLDMPQWAVVLHWDGVRWSEVPGLSARYLFGVAAAPNGDVWVAGELNGDTPLAARFVPCK